MPAYKPFTEISTLPGNANGDVTILEAHLDSAHNTITDVLEYMTQAVWSSGGVVIPGTVTNPEAALVRVQNRMGVTLDARTLLAVADQSVDLAEVATGTRCLVVIQAKAGAFTSHNFVDATTGESITHSLLSAWGKVEVIEGDASTYPVLPADCVPIAEVTKTGAAGLSIDTGITTAPTLRAGGGGGGSPDWGVGSDLADQSDLQSELEARLNKLAGVNSYPGDRTLASNDSGAYIRVTAAGTVSLPDGLATGFQCVIVNATDAATVELAAETALTIPTGFEPEIQNRRAVSVIHVGSNIWEAHGALVEAE